MRFLHSFTWLRWAPVADTSFGQEKPAYEDSGLLWGDFGTTGASKTQYYDAVQGTVTGSITFNQFPAVSPLDRLIDRQFNETWIVDGVRRDFEENITIVDCHKWANQDGSL